MNYSLELLPHDLLNHLCIYSKLLTDEDIFSLAKSCHTVLRLVGSKYELTRKTHWSMYRVIDIEAVGLTLPWTTPEAKSRYVLVDSFLQAASSDSAMSVESTSSSCTQPMTSSKAAHEHEWVILRHGLVHLTGVGCKAVPFHSLITNEYQHTPYTIGVITSLTLSVPQPPPHQLHGANEELSNRMVDADATDAVSIPEWKEGLLKVPHLRFLPLNSLIELMMTDICINEINVIQTYVWPKKLQRLYLWNFNPFLLNESMLSNWPSSLRTLKLSSYNSSMMTLHATNGRLYFPSDLTSLVLGDDCDDGVTNQILAASLPKSLTSLTCAPKPGLNDLKLNELPYLQRLEFTGDFNSSVSGWRMPSSLRELHFGIYFNQSITKLLLSNTTLTSLTLLGFSRSLKNVRFPASLTHLELGDWFGEARDQHFIYVKLPPGLQSLKYHKYIDSCVYHPKYFTYPSSLTSLEFGSVLSAAGYQPDPGALALTGEFRFILTLSPTLTRLHTPLHMLLAIEEMSIKLEHLTITCETRVDRVSKNVEDRLNRIFARTAQLKYLEFNFRHLKVQIERLILPDSIETLIIGDCGKLDVRRLVLGSKLQQLEFGVFNRISDKKVTNSFNQPINDINFPNSLKVLRLPPVYNCPLTGLILSPKLERFDLSLWYDSSQFTHLDSLMQLTFPESIKSICLPNPTHTHLQNHPSLPAYQRWVKQLQRTHPYLRISFNLFEPDSNEVSVEDDAAFDDEDEYDDVSSISSDDPF